MYRLRLHQQREIAIECLWKKLGIYEVRSKSKVPSPVILELMD